MTVGEREQPPGAGLWRIGENLPWVVPWSGEARFGIARSSVFEGLLEATQAERPGEGTPMPSGMNIMRQRRGVVEFLCHVCGEKTPVRDRYLFPVATGAFLKVKGRTRYVSHLPPTHRGCAERAQRLCPHLSATYAKPSAFPLEVGTIGPEMSVPENLSHLLDGLPPGVPVAFGYYRVFGEGFTRLVQRLRAEAAASG